MSLRQLIKDQMKKYLIKKAKQKAKQTAEQYLHDPLAQAKAHMETTGIMLGSLLAVGTITSYVLLDSAAKPEQALQALTDAVLQMQGDGKSDEDMALIDMWDGTYKNVLLYDSDLLAFLEEKLTGLQQYQNHGLFARRWCLSIARILMLRDIRIQTLQEHVTSLREVIEGQKGLIARIVGYFNNASAKAAAAQAELNQAAQRGGDTERAQLASATSPHTGPLQQALRPDLQQEYSRVEASLQANRATELQAAERIQNQTQQLEGLRSELIAQCELTGITKEQVEYYEQAIQKLEAELKGLHQRKEVILSCADLSDRELLNLPQRASTIASLQARAENLTLQHQQDYQKATGAQGSARAYLATATGLGLILIGGVAWSGAAAATGGLTLVPIVGGLLAKAAGWATTAAMAICVVGAASLCYGIWNSQTVAQIVALNRRRATGEAFMGFANTYLPTQATGLLGYAGSMINTTVNWFQGATTAAYDMSSSVFEYGLQMMLSDVRARMESELEEECGELATVHNKKLVELKGWIDYETEESCLTLNNMQNEIQRLETENAALTKKLSTFQKMFLKS